MGPTRNSHGRHGHINHKSSSNGNGASNHKRGNRGTHSNNNIELKFRNKRAPLFHHLPGHKFAGVGHGRCTIVGLRVLGHFRSNARIAPTLLIRANVIGSRGSNVGILNGKDIRGGLAIGTGGFSRTTRGTVRTTNKAIRIVWYLLF